MGEMFIAADCRFFDRAAAQSEFLEVDKYNDLLVTEINKAVDNEDSIIFSGKITKGTFEETKELFKKIKGFKYIIDYSNQTYFTVEQWHDIGFLYVWDTPGSIKAKILNEEGYIVLATDRDSLLSGKVKSNCYVAAAQSLSNQEERYKDKVLNISMYEWGFEPIELEERLPQIFDDMETFLSMEDEKEE